MEKYLYGAEIHGIQDFIFSTNKLKEMVGASQLIKDFPKKIVANLVSEKEIIQQAAGGIKCILNKKKCQQLYRELPLQLAEFAPTVSLSQYIIAVPDAIEKDHFDALQAGLDAQRQQSFPSLYNGLMGIQIARDTGKAETDKIGVDYLDKAAAKKRRYAQQNDLSQIYQIQDYAVTYPLNLEELVKDNQASDNWIAVIHADGNNLGKTIRRIIDAVKEEPNWHEKLTQFSELLEVATTKAYETAVIATFGEQLMRNASKNPLPIRPVILGGDDLTLIIDADYALTFLAYYLEAFEVETRTQLSKLEVGIVLDGFTACGGIAYTKTKFPFHYGVHLAEELCKEAKNRSKAQLANPTDKVASCLMFHRIRDAIFENYEAIKERELSFSDIAMDAGPYVIGDAHPHFSTIKALKSSLHLLKTTKGLPAHLRQWITELRYSPARAGLILDRLKQTAKSKLSDLNLEKEIEHKQSRIYDLLNLYAIETSSKT